MNWILSLLLVVLLMNVSCNSKVAEPENASSIQSKTVSLLEDKGALNLDSLIAISLNKKQPILLYFTAFTTVGGRTLEQKIFGDSEIQNQLEADFIFVTVYVDNRLALPESEWVYFDKLDKTGKTVGEVNIYSQMELCNLAAQPYFVALNSDRKITCTGEYQDFKNSSDFQEFMDRIKLSFNK